MKAHNAAVRDDELAKPSTKSLGDRVAKGIAWLTVGRVAVRLLDLFSMIVLARLLTPDDFGLVALAMTFSAMLELMTAFGIEAALIRYQQADRTFYDTAWTLSMIRSFIIAGALLVGASPAAAFFGEPRLTSIVMWLAVPVLLEGVRNIAIIDFVKHLQFNNEFKIVLIEKFCQVLASTAAAIVLHNYWALIIGLVTGKLARVTLSYCLISFRPHFGIKRLRELLSFGVWTFISAIMGFLGLRAPAFFLGKMIDPTAVGLFNVSFNLANLGSTEILNPIRTVLFPGYAKLSATPSSLRSSFVLALGLSLTVGTPAAVGIAMVSDPLVLVCLGRQWIGAAPIVSALAIFSLCQTGVTATGGLYMAMGRPQYVSYLGIVFGILTIPLLYIFISEYGTIGAAYAMIVVAIGYSMVDVCIVSRLIRLSVRDLLSATWRPLMAAAGMAAVLYCMGAVLVLGAHLPPPFYLASLVVCGALSYCCMLFGLWKLSGSPKTVEHYFITYIFNFIVTPLRGFF